MIVKPTVDIRKYLSSNVGKYVNKSKGLKLFVDELKRKYEVKEIFKHDLGENADGPSPYVLAEFKELVSTSKIISEYPDSSYSKLRKELAKYYEIEFENISLGTGSSELIERISRTWIETGNRIIFPVPSFYKIEDIILGFGGVPVYIRLREDEDFQWNENTTNELTLMAKETKTKLIWLVNPNNPTGGIIPLEEIIKIVRQNTNSIVIVDEAYGEYIDFDETPCSAVALVKQGAKNILVLRSFSKIYGLAGLRLGYCIGSKELIKILERIRLEFPVNAIVERLAIVALRDRDYIINSVRKTSWNRKLLEESLSMLDNLKYVPSKTNILLIKHNSKNLYEELIKCGILVAKMEITGIKGKNYIRMTIKNVEENKRVVNAIENLNNINLEIL